MSTKSFFDTVKDLFSSKKENVDNEEEVKEKPLVQTTSTTDNYDFAVALLCQVDAKVNVAISPSGAQGLLALFRLGSGIGSKQDKELQKYFPGERESFAKALVTERQEFLKCDGIKVMDIIAVRDDITVLDKFQELVKEIINIERLDVNNGDSEVNRLNDMGKKFTNGLIPAFLEKGSIGSALLMLAINLIYFKKNWKIQFNPKDTRDGNFLSITGSNNITKLMILRDCKYAYYEDSDNQYLRIPYEGDIFSLTVILPINKRYLPSITPGLLRKCREQFTKSRKTQIEILVFPNCLIETNHDLKKMFRRMGINAIFDAPNFDEMLNKYATITEFKQKAVVKFNEEGTEAAAITHAISKECKRDFTPPKKFIADHPFTYAIEHMATGQLIFMGNVVAL